MLRSLTTDIPLLLKREASGERLTHRSFQKLNSLLFCNFTRLCLSIGMIPAFDLYSLIVPLTTHQPNQPSWNFWGEIPSKIWRFRNSTPGFFEPVRDCSFISQCKFGVPRDPFHPICNIVINWDDRPPPLPHYNIVIILAYPLKMRIRKTFSDYMKNMDCRPAFF